MIVRLLRARPATTILLAILAIAAGLLLGAFDTAREAGAEPVCNYSFNPGTDSGKGRTNPWDGNGCVPEGYGVVGTCSNNVIGRTTWYMGGTGYSGPQANGAPYQHQVLYDRCEMNSHNANATDWRKLYAHERAHCRGWGHYENPRSSNAAWDPIAVYW